MEIYNMTNGGSHPEFGESQNYNTTIENQIAKNMQGKTSKAGL